MHWFAVGVLVLALAVPAAAQQSEGRYRENYEVGMTFFEVGQYARAAEYLKAAVAEKPGQPEAAVAYGATLVKLKNFEAAIGVLSQVKAEGPLGAEAAFYLGEAHREKGAKEAARDAYRLAAGAPGSLGPRALLEAGRLSSAMGDADGARDDFQRVLQMQAAGELLAEAKAKLAELGTGSQRFGMYIDLGTRYDSNVRLAQEPASGDGGFRMIANAYGRMRAFDAANFRSDVALSVNQGRYLSAALQPLDMGVQRLNGDFTYKASALPLRAGLDVEASYSTLDFGYYAFGAGAGPRVLVAEGENFATSVSWMWKRENYALLGRDAVQRNAMLQQFAFWGKAGYAGAGLSYQQNAGQDPTYQYDILGGRLFAGNVFGPEIAVDGGVDVSRTPYRKFDRTETTMAASGGVGKYWGKMGVRFSGAYVVNSSEGAVGAGGYDFQKAVIGLDFRLRY